MKNQKAKENYVQHVTFFIAGGLGNQMFQYAFGRTVADRRSCELMLDISELECIRADTTPRKYSLNAFNIRAHTDSSAIKNSRSKRLLPRVFPWASKTPSIRMESGNGFQSNIACDDYSSIYRGYWQSHHYFSSNAARIFQDFTPKNPLSPQAFQLLDAIKSNNSVMIHVRMGDYVSSRTVSSCHFTLSSEYYMSAYNLVCKAVKNPSFFVFSDDIEWCKGALKFIDRPISFVSPNSLQADWEDLIVMSHCKHHIIANSSFSWWSAWLADQRYGVAERFVSAPLRWFVKESINPYDRFPSHWITL